MGLFKDVKASTIGAEARRAIEVGRRVFTPMLVIPGTKPSMSGAIDDWAVMIDAIEAEGGHWTASQCQVTSLSRTAYSGEPPSGYRPSSPGHDETTGA